MKRTNTKQYDLPEGSKRVYDDQGRRAWQIPGLPFLVESRKWFVMHVEAIKKLMHDGEGWKPGMQIAYVPDHANGNLDHPDVEFGFITSVKDDACFCRYWSKGKIGKELRTTSYSELTPASNLRQIVSTHQVVVNELVNAIHLQESDDEKILHGNPADEGSKGVIDA